MKIFFNKNEYKKLLSKDKDIGNWYAKKGCNFHSTHIFPSLLCPVLMFFSQFHVPKEISIWRSWIILVLVLFIESQSLCAPGFALFYFLFAIGFLVLFPDPFIYCINFTYIVIITGFLSTILCEGKDFVATWFQYLKMNKPSQYQAFDPEWGCQ